MHSITVNTTDFASALGRVVNASDRSGHLPILSHVRIRTSADKMGLTCTDNEIEMTTTLPVAPGQDVDFSLPVRKLYDIFRTLPAQQEAVIEVDDTGATIRCQRSKFTLLTLPSSVFPTIDDFSPDVSIKLPQSVLALLISRVAFSVANNDVRAYLNGALLEIDSELVCLVGTDGHRLAVCERTSGVGAALTAPIQALIPRQALAEIAKLVQKGTGDVGIDLTGNHVRVTVPGTRLIARLLDAKFPDWRRVVPNALPHHMTVSRDDFSDALARAKLVSEQKAQGVILDMTPDVLTLRSSAVDGKNSSVDEIMADATGSVVIGVNVDYILDAVHPTAGERVTIQFDSPNSALVIAERLDETTRALSVIMPMCV